MGKETIGIWVVWRESTGCYKREHSLHLLQLLQSFHLSLSLPLSLSLRYNGCCYSPKTFVSGFFGRKPLLLVMTREAILVRSCFVTKSSTFPHRFSSRILKFHLWHCKILEDSSIFLEDLKIHKNLACGNPQFWGFTHWEGVVEKWPFLHLSKISRFPKKKPNQTLTH